MKNFFRKKPVKIIISILVVILIVVGASNAVFAKVALEQQHGVAVCDSWSPEQAYKKEDAKQMDIGTQDYKVLCLTDVHIRNHATFGAAFGVNFVLDAASKIQLRKLIERENPNLIVVTGDTVLTEWNDISLQKFSDFMDEFKIPWAHVYGNHDYEGRADKSKLSEILAGSEYGLFTYGPDGMNGMGNYILNLNRGDKTVYSLFMIDDGQYRIADGKISDGGVTDRQIQWYNWAIDGIAKENGGAVPSMAFMHVGVPEYKEIKDGYSAGQRGEDSCTAAENNGFFDAFKAAGGTHIFVGHDHANNFLATYEGINLNYITKSSYNCYFTFKALGGTTVTIDANNAVKVENVTF